MEASKIRIGQVWRKAWRRDGTRHFATITGVNADADTVWLRWEDGSTGVRSLAWFDHPTLELMSDTPAEPSTADARPTPEFDLSDVSDGVPSPITDEEATTPKTRAVADNFDSRHGALANGTAGENLTPTERQAKQTAGFDALYGRKPEEARSLESKPAPASGRDLKAGLTGTKPQLAQLPFEALVYPCRALEYGGLPKPFGKYQLGNYHRPAPDNIDPAERVLGYLSAMLRHGGRVVSAVTRAKGVGGDVKAAFASRDDDHDGKFPPSMLPDLAGMAASALLAIQTAINDGLIPADPGRPWVDLIGKPVETWPGTNTAPAPKAEPAKPAEPDPRDTVVAAAREAHRLLNVELDRVQPGAPIGRLGVAIARGDLFAALDKLDRGTEAKAEPSPVTDEQAPAEIREGQIWRRASGANVSVLLVRDSPESGRRVTFDDGAYVSERYVRTFLTFIGQGV
jgi:hypothetical protein